MKLSLLIFLILVEIFSNKTILRFDRSDNPVISAGDTIISTLGIFKMTLQDDCSFDLFQFNTT